METKEQTISQTTLHHVRGADLPATWAQQAGVDADQLVNVTIGLVASKGKKVRLENIMQKIDAVNAMLDPSKVLTDNELYDDNGLPK